MYWLISSSEEICVKKFTIKNKSKFQVLKPIWGVVTWLDKIQDPLEWANQWLTYRLILHNEIWHEKISHLHARFIPNENTTFIMKNMNEHVDLWYLWHVCRDARAQL